MTNSKQAMKKLSTQTKKAKTKDQSKAASKPKISKSKDKLPTATKDKLLAKKTKPTATKKALSRSQPLTLNADKYVHNKHDHSESKEYKTFQHHGKVKTHLSDKELEHFKQILLKRKQEVVEDLEILRSSISTEDSTRFNTSYSQHMAEHGTDSMNKEQMFLFIQRDEKYLSHIEKALDRIKNKTYGICIASGKPIPKSRLEAVPHTTVRIEYKNR